MIIATKVIIWAVFTTIALHLGVLNVDGKQCYEDEAVVMVIATWDDTNTSNKHDVPIAELACAAVDNIRIIEPRGAFRP